MAAPDLSKILIVPGRLCINPGNLSTAWPHGGTGLGLTADVVVRPGQNYVAIPHEYYGDENYAFILTGQAWTLSAKLRSFDSDAVHALFPYNAVGTTSGEYGVVYPNGSVPGAIVSSVKLLFTPDDDENHPFVYFPNAIPLIDKAAALDARLNEEFTTAVVFHAVRDGSGRVAMIQRKEDLTL